MLIERVDPVVLEPKRTVDRIIKQVNLLGKNPLLAYAGTWTALTQYSPGDVVNDGVSNWLALTKNINVTPIEGLDWTKIGAVGGGGSAAILDPTTVPDCTGWWLGEAMDALADGASVPQWDDASATLNHAVAVNAGILKKNIINGRSVLRMDAVDDYYNTSFDHTGPYTVFAVFAYNSAASANRRMLASTTQNWLVGPYSGRFQAYNGAFITGRGVNTAFHIHCLTGDSSFGRYFFDNEYVSYNTSGNVPRILRFGMGTFSEPADSDVAAVASFNRIISRSEREGIFAGLASSTMFDLSI